MVGGGSGIGRAAALAYLGAGARVTVVERSAELAAALRKETDDRVTVVVGDGTRPDVLAAGVASAGGGGGLDHLTCCVGVFDHYASLRQLDTAQLLAAAEETWRLNVLSALLAAHAAWPALRETGGSITLTLSESAFRPVGGGVLYGSSKWALRGVVQHLAADFAPAVRVNGVAPGGTTDTRFSGLDALGQSARSVADSVGRADRIAAGTLLGTAPTPADHAAAFLHLADPVAARVVTGQVLLVDGGRTPS
ncbi:SDR family oxidoreductase [Amycolatopsis sp. VS8301801F10]|uniref:SDR family oxidoreductase n=1 Tax=Amycolatopsis sp. VS8301801F10 TaxID=2652442 RepID=UPI0038FBF205